MQNWSGQKVLIIGAARQGLALARFLSGHDAVVTLNDQRSPEQLAHAQESLRGLPVQWVLGEHPLSLLDTTDVVCVSGGVPLNLPIVTEALARGIPITNDSQIFLDAVPCPVIAITGSAGKTTTTTLVGRMAQSALEPARKVWIGGNIGLPLVEYLGQIQPDDQVVLELSSFQLELMTRSPQVAAVLNVTPNHLDRHGTFEAYTAAKARILQFQSPADTAVLNRDDPTAWSLRNMVRGWLVTFGRQCPETGSGTFLDGDRLCLSQNGKVTHLLDSSDILLRGEHNRLNVLAACAIAFAAGLPVEAMQAGVAGFRGVAHRLEFVATVNGADWYNDSIATAPERTLAAIQSFSEPLVLLLGGRDKKLPWDMLAEAVSRRVDHVVLFGEAAGMIEAVLHRHAAERPYSIQRVAGLEQAVQAAAQVAQPGNVVLLSPGGTSYDEFIDFEQRGERYRQWVQQLS